MINHIPQKHTTYTKVNQVDLMTKVDGIIDCIRGLYAELDEVRAAIKICESNCAKRAKCDDCPDAGCEDCPE